MGQPPTPLLTAPRVPLVVTAPGQLQTPPATVLQVPHQVGLADHLPPTRQPTAPLGQASAHLGPGRAEVGQGQTRPPTAPQPPTALLGTMDLPTIEIIQSVPNLPLGCAIESSPLSDANFRVQPNQLQFIECLARWR